MANSNNTFEYTYSAREQAEIKKIRAKYSEPEKREPTSIEKLRALGESVTKKATTLSLIMGIIGSLALGTGMSIAMTGFARILGDLSYLSMPIGILIGLIGIVFGSTCLSRL